MRGDAGAVKRGRLTYLKGESARTVLQRNDAPLMRGGDAENVKRGRLTHLEVNMLVLHLTVAFMVPRSCGAMPER